ncbi:MAG: class I SAM-dependent methyltransferase [Candidatus Binatia bacterium]
MISVVRKAWERIKTQYFPIKDPDSLQIVVSRGKERFIIPPKAFDNFAFKTGDELAVTPAHLAVRLPVTPDGSRHVSIGKGKAIRLPSRVELYEYKGYALPVHLVMLTGAGPETWEPIGKAHIANYAKFMGLAPDMTILEIGCGIGRDAFQFLDVLGPDGRYIGVDVTRDSIVWCQKNISRKHPNFQFHHFDAKHELYNLLGTNTTRDFVLPAGDRSVDRVALQSVFTHLFEDEVVHYMKEIARVLRPPGLAYATFFLYSKETIAAARRTDRTPFKLRFEHSYGDGCYVNDAAYPTGAVAYTDAAMRKMISQARLRLDRPYLKGWWSGAYEVADDGQEVAILSVPSSF